MPDDVQRPIYAGDNGNEFIIRDVDDLDELLTFVTYRPAWVGPDGFPLSWQHYKYGLQHIARDNMRQQLWMAQSFRLGRQKDENWEVFQRDTNRLTEVPTHG